MGGVNAGGAGPHGGLYRAVTIRPGSVALLEEGRPGEAVLDGGAARADDLDREISEELAAVRGDPIARATGVGAPGSDWLATRWGIYYVSPGAESLIGWSWPSIVGMRFTRRRLTRLAVELHLEGSGSVEVLEMSRAAGARLFGLWQHLRSR